MELEAIKSFWEEMSIKIEKQNKLTDKLIMDMTQERYRNRFQKLLNYEVVGAMVCFAMVIILLLNIEKLDTWYLIACGVFSGTYLLILPILVLRSINRIKRINVAGKNFKETLINFTKAKQKMLFLQRIGVSLNFLLLFAIMPVVVKIMSSKDIFAVENNTWFWFILSMSVILLFVSKWGYRYYKRIADSAEVFIKDLQN